MADEKDDDQGDAPADSRARWNTDAAGIEQAGTVVEIEEHMTPEQRERNAKAAALQDEVRVMALRAAAEGDAEADPDEDVAARKD